MWIYSKTRGEHDRRFLLNLDKFANVTLSQIGEKWYVDVSTKDDSSSIATLETEEQAENVLRQIYDSLAAGVQALDLDASSGKAAEKPGNEEKREEEKQATGK